MNDPSVSPKYKLLEETNKNGLFRIQALRSFSDVTEGDHGGFVQDEDNLSHKGNCWIYDNAEVRDQARVKDNAVLRGQAVAKSCSQIREEAVLDYKCKVTDNAIVQGNAIVRGRATVSGNSLIFGGAVIQTEAHVTEFAQISEDAIICGESYVSGWVRVEGQAAVLGKTVLTGLARVVGDNKLTICDVYIGGQAFIRTHKDFISVVNLGAEGDSLSSWKDARGDIYCSLSGYEGRLDKVMEYIGRDGELTLCSWEFGSSYQNKLLKAVEFSQQILEGDGD